MLPQACGVRRGGWGRSCSNPAQLGVFLSLCPEGIYISRHPQRAKGDGLHPRSGQRLWGWDTHQAYGSRHRGVVGMDGPRRPSLVNPEGSHPPLWKAQHSPGWQSLWLSQMVPLLPLVAVWAQ